MNIVYSHHAFCMQRHGGVSRYFTELFQRIPDCGDASTRIVAPLSDNEYLANGRGVRSDAIIGIEVPSLPGPVFPRRKANALLSRWICRRLRNVDVFHQTYFSRSDDAPPGARRVLTVFDMIHELSPGDFRSGDPTREAKRLSVERADHVICISGSTRDDLVRLLGVPPKKVSVVHLAGDLGVAPAAVGPVATPHRPFLLYVGRREGYKNFAALLVEFAATPALRNRFDLICFGGGDFSAGERAAIVRSGLAQGQVAWRPGGDAALAASYAQATALVYPSLYEGFGIPPLEAMAAGCPVVCAATSSLPEVAGDAAEYFDAAVPGAIAAALLRLLEDPARRAALAARGLVRAQMFSWERCARETLEVYRKVLAT